jgi:hypothetical protein
MLCVGQRRSKYILEFEAHSEYWRRRSLVDCWVILSQHLPCPSPNMSEEIRYNKLPAAKKLLKRFKYWKKHCVIVEERKIKTSKLVATLSYSPTVSEDASHDHNAPAPSAQKAALSASVPSPEGCIHNIKSLAYEDIFFM